MDDALSLLLWCGGLGWFSFTFLLALGNNKGWLHNLFVNTFMWLICMDIIATIIGIIVPLVHKFGIGWRFVGCFIILPYLLGLLRLRWLLRYWRRAAAASPLSSAAM